VQNYEEQAHTLIMSAVNTPNNKEISKQLKVLLKEVEKDITTAQKDASSQQLYNRLMRLKEYIQSNMKDKPNGTNDPVDQLNEYEARLFSLITEANDEEVTNTKASSTKSKIADLMKDLTSFKAKIRKMDDEQRLLNRLEDLQENLADLEHNFNTRIFTEKSMSEKANALLKSKQLEDANKEHQRIANEMFEL